MRRTVSEAIKRQTDRILRQRSLNGTASVTVTSNPGGGGLTVNNPVTELEAHKTSADHDGRYYTEDEVDSLLAALQGAFAEVYRDTFDNTDTIIVVHNLGFRPVVQIIGQVVADYGDGLYSAGAYGGIDATANALLNPSSIIHDSINQITVTLAVAMTGEVICVG